MMTPDDLTTLTPDRFENLVHALLRARDDFRILEPPSRGTDGGIDIFVEWQLRSNLRHSVERVVVQCKHSAHVGKSLSESEVGYWKNARDKKEATGYLLVTNRHLSKNVVASLVAPDRPGYWAQAWDCDRLLQELHGFPDLIHTYFPHLAPHASLRPPHNIVDLRDQLIASADQMDRLFDLEDWVGYADHMRQVRYMLGRQQAATHFERFFHFKRLPQFQLLKQRLSAHQLAFEKWAELRAVEKMSAPPRDPSELVRFLNDLDPVYGASYLLAQEESERFRVFTNGKKQMAMVGCGALSYTLIHTYWSNRSIHCTGLDYDNGSLVQAHLVRRRMGMVDRLHYVVTNGDAFDYRDQDVILVANIVSNKAAVLWQIARTASKGAIVIIRNPVTFGEVLWEDAQYHDIDNMERVDGLESSEAFGECFETVVMRLR